MSSAPLARLWRYYQVGVINTLFSYSIYSLLVAAGLNMYVAQIVAHVLGTAFNYFTYSRHVFHHQSASKLRFLLSYLFNYFLGLASLALASLAITSPYLAGFVALLFTSLINYVILKRLVFIPQVA